MHYNHDEYCPCETRYAFCDRPRQVILELRVKWTDGTVSLPEFRTEEGRNKFAAKLIAQADVVSVEKL